jgi:RNA polymerase sigma factor (sigma-70 family)
LAAVPSIGRANHVEGDAPREAHLTQALYEQYAHQIFRYCLHQLGTREEAEDAVQSTFLNAFRGIKRGIVPELESAWLFKIAQNVCLSRRRSSWRRGRIESPTDFEVVEELTAAPTRREDELIGLQDVLETMPENQRRAILLREWQGLSYREIADELELSQAAVETLIFRARRTLAVGLEQPPERMRRRVARAADLGNIVTAVKSLLLGGSAAAKVAATVAVVSATTVVAAEPVQRHHQHLSAAPTPKQAPAHAGKAPAARHAVHTPAPVSKASASAPTPVAKPHRPTGHVAVKTRPAVATPAPAVAQPQPIPAPETPAPVVEAPAPPAAPVAAQPSNSEPATPPAKGDDQGSAKDVRRSQSAETEQPWQTAQPTPAGDDQHGWHGWQQGSSEETSQHSHTRWRHESSAAPVVTAPTVTAPTVTAPTVTPPPVPTPTVPTVPVTAPTVTTPATTLPAAPVDQQVRDEGAQRGDYHDQALGG